MPSQNKPLQEYGDLHSEHHNVRNAPDVPEIPDDEPAKLVIVDGPGNLYLVQWTKGDEPLPPEVAGHWNHKGKASEAIRGAEARMHAEKSHKALAEFQAQQAVEAKAAEELAAAEIELEKQRLIAEEKAKAAAEEAASEEPEPVKPRRRTTKK